MTARPRLAVPVTYSFSVRYLLRTTLFDRLSEDWTPLVLLSWQDEALAEEIRSRGGEAHLLPAVRYGPNYRRLRRLLDVAHTRRLRSPSTASTTRREEALLDRRTRWLKRRRRAALRVALLGPGVEAAARRAERRRLESDTNFAAAAAFADRLQPDAVLSLTPFHEAEDLFLRAVEGAGLPRAACFISFDNVTTRGWIPTTFDRYLVWNRHNEAELARAYPASTGAVDIVGAPQFDFYADATYRWSAESWRSHLDLPADRPVLLFGGGPPSIAPHEPHVLCQIDHAISDGHLPGELVVVFRRHPLDPVARWASTMASTRNVVYDEPWTTQDRPKHASMDREDIERFVSTLAHAAVHANISSTMTVDGAAFDRPQIGPAYDDRPGRPLDRFMRELYQREHWLPIAASGGMDIVHSAEELFGSITAGLDDPARQAHGRARLVEEVTTFTDGKASDRVAAAVATALRWPRRTKSAGRTAAET